MNEETKELVKFRIEKAFDTFNEAVYQIKGGMWNLAVNRLYACYYMVIALLLCEELFPKTHKGVHNLFYKNFVEKNLISPEFSILFSTLYDAR